MLFISVMQSVNGAQFLNFCCLSFLSVCHAASVVPTPTTVMSPLTSIYASL